MKRTIGLVLFLLGLMISTGFYFSPFLDIPSLFFVSLISGSLVLIEYKKDFTRNDLIMSIKKNLIFSGWIGFLIGLILFLGTFDSNDLNREASKFAIALITVLYGYVFAYLAEFFNHD